MSDDVLHIAFVEDDPHTRKAVAASLTARGFVVEAFEGVPDYMPSAHVALLDLNLRESTGTDGPDTLERALAVFTATPIVILTGDSRPRVHEECVRAGAYHVITKPAPMEQIASVLRQAYASIDRTRTDPARVHERIRRIQEMALGVAATVALAN